MRIINFIDGFQSSTTPLVQPIPASDISVTPTGNLTELNVQAALEGIYIKHIDKTLDVHGVISNVMGVDDIQTITNKLFGQSLLSTANNLHDIGTGASRFKNLYLGSNAYIDGSIYTYGALALFDTTEIGTNADFFDMNITGVDANAEGVGLRVKRNTGGHYQMIFDSALISGFKMGAAGSESEVITSNASQTLTNKTIDSDNNTITNISDSNIKSGANINTDKLAPGNANYVMIRDDAGKLSDEQYLSKVRGGTGISSTATFPSSGVIVTEDATQTLSNKTIQSGLLSGGSLDTSIAGNFDLLASVGGYNINVGHALSTVVIQGNLSVLGGVSYIYSTDLQVTDKNILVNKGGNAASMNGAGLTVDNSGGTNGSFVYDSALVSKWKCGLEGSEVELANVSGSQIFTNKTHTNAVINNTITGTAIIDTDDLSGAVTQKLATSRAVKTYVDDSIAAITSSFTDLTDTPSNYTSQAAKILTVNDTPDAISFRNLVQTSNQVLISTDANGYTFSLPQNIHDAAIPTFAGLRIKPNSFYADISIKNNLTANRDFEIDLNDKNIDLDFGSAENGQALVYDETNQKWKPGASGDSSFKIQGRGTTGNDYVLIKGGMLRDGQDVLITDDGSDDVYKSGLAVDIEYQLSANDLNGTVKANNTNYWLYIDKDSLNEVVVEYSAGSDTPLTALAVTSSSFVYSPDTPESGDINTNRYIPIGYFRTDGSGNINTTENTFLEVIPRVTKSGGSQGTGVQKDTEEYTTTGLKTYTHDKGKEPDVVELYYYDSSTGKTKPLIQEVYITDKTIDDIDIDLTSLAWDSGDKVYLHCIWFTSISALLNLTEDSSPWIISSATTSFAHKLLTEPKGITLVYDDNGTIRYKDYNSFVVSANSTTVTFNWGSLTLDTTHRIKCFVSGASRPVGIDTNNFSVGQFSTGLLKTAVDYAITNSDGYKTIIATVINKTITLPNPVNNAERELTIKKGVSGNGTTTIAPYGSEKIEGIISNHVLDFYNEFITLQSDGTDWYIISKHIPENQISLSVSGNNSWSTVRAIGTIYKTNNGIWRLRFNIVGNSSSVNYMTIILSNIVFKNIAGFEQAVAANQRSNTKYAYGQYCTPNTSNITCHLNITNTSWTFSGDLELNAKPSIAV